MAQKEKILPEEPPILKRIQSVRMKLADSDRDDHIAEVDQWEVKAKHALIMINLQGHEGMKMMIDKARQEIKEINWSLVKEEDNEAQFSYDPHILISKQLKREDLLKMRRLWEWFLGMFDEAEDNIKSITSELDLQDQEITEETP